jgi:ADP-ribose pyrophosphatase YjhB (NUDIX family)
MAYLDLIRERVGRQKIFLVFGGACVRDGRDRVLWQRRGDFGWWGLPGGMLEMDESLPQCVRREVREETGLEVKPGRLVGLYSSPSFDVTYPNGDEVQQVTACYECRIVGEPPRRLNSSRVDAAETLELEWYPAGFRPPTARWYEAMASDLVLNLPTPSFRRGAAGGRRDDRSFLRVIEERCGPAVVIMPAAAGIVLDDDRRVLLVRRRERDCWSLPGGMMELGERIDRTAVHEIAEQTGLKVEPVELIGIYTDSHPPAPDPDGNRVKLVTALFHCRVAGGRVGSEGDASTDTCFFSLDALPPLEAEQAARLGDGLAATDRAGG